MSTGNGLRPGYGTSGFGDHRLEEAIDLLAGLGYSGVAITLDAKHLDPFDPRLRERLAALRERLARHRLTVAVETGGRYLLDPLRKHHPTLLSHDGAARRVGLLRTALEIAADLGAPVMSCWSGAAPAGMPEPEAWDRLAANLRPVLDRAEALGVDVGFEPEPGMFVDTIDGFEQLRARLGAPAALRLTLDIGHCQCLEAQSPAQCVRRTAAQLAHVQISDMRRGVHEHLEFGQGDLQLPSVLAALADAGYTGLVSVELPRHGHDAPGAAARSLAALRAGAPR